MYHYKVDDIKKQFKNLKKGGGLALWQSELNHCL